MSYGWPNTPQGIKFFHIAHQKDNIFKTTFRTVSRQNLGRDPAIQQQKPSSGAKKIYSTKLKIFFIYSSKIEGPN